MIEKRIKNELTLKRYKRFKARKSAVFAVVVLVVMTIMTFSAPLIANSKPLFMTYEGKVFFPVFNDYHPKDFGITDSLVVDYRKIAKDNPQIMSVWPAIQWDPYESNNDVYEFPGEPTSVNLLGTDDRGRDVLTRLIYGFKYSISYAVLVWIISTVLGTIFGGIMGYFGGTVDIVGQRIVEVFSTIPVFFLLLILVSIFQPTLILLVLITSIFGWISISYYVRGEFLKNRKLEFVEAARSMGASTSSILFKHILPNSMTPLITFAPFTIAGLIASLASLDYLGFGLQVPTPSWGELLSQAQKNYSIAWWLAVYPSAALFTTLFMFVLVGDGVRDAFDPKAQVD